MAVKLRSTILSLGLGKVFFLALVISVPALASRDTVLELFRNAKYEEARLNMEQGAEGFQAGEATLWQVRLADDPANAGGGRHGGRMETSLEKR